MIQPKCVRYQEVRAFTIQLADTGIPEGVFFAEGTIKKCVRYRYYPVLQTGLSACLEYWVVVVAHALLDSARTSWVSLRQTIPLRGYPCLLLPV